MVARLLLSLLEGISKFLMLTAMLNSLAVDSMFLMAFEFIEGASILRSGI